MNLGNSLFFLLAAPALTMAQRELAIADWSMALGTITKQSIDFTTSTPAESVGIPNVKISVSDVCRTTSATRNELGQLYPVASVAGFEVDSTGVTTGVGGTNGIGGTFNIKFSFDEGINGQTLIYTPGAGGADAVEADVDFCMTFGFYDGATLVEFAEVELHYDIDLVAGITALTGYAVTQAETYTANDQGTLSFDGTLTAQFCASDHATPTVALTSAVGITTQGTTRSVCIYSQGANIQFQVRKVIGLTITDDALAVTQAVWANSAVAEAGYADSACVDASDSDMNYCWVDFLLKANFFETAAVTLTGSGSVLMELGNSVGATRRMLRQDVRSLQENGTEEEFKVKPTTLNMEVIEGSSATAVSTISALAVIAGAAMML